MTFLVSIVGLLFLILIHEAGHFFVALAVGIKPRKFYIGFPPAIVKTVRNGIEYGIGAIPLGGYVRIPGMHRPAAKDVQVNFAPALREAPELQEPLAAAERPLDRGDLAAARAALPQLQEAFERAYLSRVARKSGERGLRDLEESLGSDAYWRQPTWKRITVIFAGPGVNILFAIGLLALVYILGVPNTNTRAVDAVSGNTPAAHIGLEPGDVIVAVNGQKTATFQQIRNRIQASKGKPVTVTVERHGRLVTLGSARTMRASDGRWVLGFTPGIRYKSYGVLTSFRFALDDCWQATKGMGLAIEGLFHHKGRDQLTSTVGIVKVSSNALKVSFRLYLQILGLISLSLALLNLLPLLPLDGGHILFSAIEGIRRRAVAREVYERASVVGFALILLIAFIALSNDLSGRGPG
ncbi:MAG: PDZ domain-containing protein [Actinobacteria bacterium]|nr:MAG: PDZ domain-containing protein [Actinomycetota bacterium]